MDLDRKSNGSGQDSDWIESVLSWIFEVEVLDHLLVLIISLLHFDAGLHPKNKLLLQKLNGIINLLISDWIEILIF